MRKKILLSSVPVEDIVPTALAGRRKVTLNTPEECFWAANNIEFMNGVRLPNYTIGFIQANLPWIEILEAPTWHEYEKALAQGYDAIGISFWTYTSQAAVKMAKLARAYGIKQVWGGGHGVHTPGVQGHFDRLFSGFSEYDLKPFLDGKELKHLRHPVMIRETKFFLKKIRTGFLASIRGCRFGCSFCSGPHYYKRQDYTPLEEIEKTLDAYLKQDVSHIFLLDQTFLQDKKYANKVIHAIHRRNLSWHCASRVDLLQNHIGELKQKGMLTAYFGIESMNDLALQGINKGETANQTIALLKELEKNKVAATGTYMVGLDFDTIEITQDAIEILNKFNALYNIIFWVATPFPGTAYFDRYEREGKIIDRNWKHYDLLHLVKKHPFMTPQQARELLAYCVRNHCHDLNLTKAKVLRIWDKLEQKTTHNPVIKRAGSAAIVH